MPGHALQTARRGARVTVQVSAADKVHLQECTVICGCQQHVPARLMDLQTRQAR